MIGTTLVHNGRDKTAATAGISITGICVRSYATLSSLTTEEEHRMIHGKDPLQGLVDTGCTGLRLCRLVLRHGYLQNLAPFAFQNPCNL